MCTVISVTLYARLLVRTRISENKRPNFTKSPTHAASGRGSILLWQRCDTLCTSGFVVDGILRLQH